LEQGESGLDHTLQNNGERWHASSETFEEDVVHWCSRGYDSVVCHEKNEHNQNLNNVAFLHLIKKIYHRKKFKITNKIKRIKTIIANSI